MKKLFTLLSFIATIAINAQAPQGFNYQAIVRNSSGQLLLNQDVLVKFNILQNSSKGDIVYSETQTANTDDLGQINLVVGRGTAPTGTFSTINWGNGSYYLNIELNIGSGYVAMGTTQLLSVPYALYANTSGSTIGNTGGLTHYIGELYGGGIVVSVWKKNGVEHGLIASLTDLSAGIQWTTPNYETTTVSGIGALSPQDGLSNSNSIMTQVGSGNSYAAGLCRSYNEGSYADWYLPAIWELNQCYNAAKIVNEVLGNINGFQFSLYWSSTEDYYNSAWNQSFFDGGTQYSMGDSNKLNNFRVRAVRRF
jgi:hypothetical protein